MKAVLLVRQRVLLRTALFKEMVIWQIPRQLTGSLHNYKYRLALIDAAVCVLRYDNEAGKGDHKHIGDIEDAYAFDTIERLLEDFEMSVGRYLDGRIDHR